MTWFEKPVWNKIKPTQKKKEVPDGLWLKCDNCGDILYREELARSFWICRKCRYHFRISSWDYRTILLDGGRFDEFDTAIKTADPLEFEDLITYKSRIKKNRNSAGIDEAVTIGLGHVMKKEVAFAFMDFGFIGGSMGSVVGEKVARLFGKAIEKKLPVLTVACSGGARMQEGILSLMQMAKTSALVAKLDKCGLPYISILTNPTTAGVMASFASLGDIIIAEPGAHLGFAGPRVIKQTIGEELPPGFQKSEFFLEHGMIDMIVERDVMREKVSLILELLHPARD